MHRIINDIYIMLCTLLQAGVWLRKAECVKSLGRLEEAALAYARVVTLAPNHLDARLTLATLHQQLGRPDQALDVLNSMLHRKGCYFHVYKQPLRHACLIILSDQRFSIKCSAASVGK